MALYGVIQKGDTEWVVTTPFEYIEIAGQARNPQMRVVNCALVPAVQSVKAARPLWCL